ncbi:acyloxyacyl hydrolase [Thiomicrorhabdus sp. zzn3]|uniref:acyloxyacyl hydrolase n=1 Tax=Thiomicrorhabdus sp. zzn3 TaxID=3039775 RepID=UPI0024366C9C|nr:acyloxyacyl hydrolase [Thiomicrorhabdus sp. zzn3]MDG6777345.1 acyloxyacyl hydrolase [Thiomicrorhabdus sp. zzn3]
MHRHKPHFSLLFSLMIALATLTHTTSARAESNNSPMTFAIAGSLLSFGMACYQGKAPCSLSPGIDTDKTIASFDMGSDDTIDHLRLALGADWKESFYQSGPFEINGRWEVNANHWHSTRANPENKQGYIIGVHPLFQYNYAFSNFKLYAETGAGLYLLDDPTIENEFKSTQFQFGDVFGLGVKVKQFELGYRYLHISNAGIEMPNPGTDFHNLHLGYRF